MRLWQRTGPIRLGVVAMTVATALVMVAGATAATMRVAVGGSVTLTDQASGVTIQASLSGVAGNVTYTGIGFSADTGTLTVTTSTAPFQDMSGPGAGLTVFHGDVSQGCVRVQGNRTLVVGHLPPEEQFDIPFGHMEWVALHVEDNGVVTGSPVDRARVSFSRTTSGSNHCNASADPFPGAAPVIALDSGDVTLSYTDLLDGHASNPDTDVSVVDPNGLSVAISDSPDPDGMSVTAGPGSGFAQLDSCGTQVNVNAGSTAVLTCGSLIAEVVVGSIEIVLADGLTTVSIPEGGKAEIEDDGTGGFVVENLGVEPISIVVDGVTSTVDPGDPPRTLEAWDFEGFFRPVDNLPTLNKVKAGAAVPLKWRLIDASGAPVTDLASATITVSTLDCTTGEESDEVEQTATVGPGLQNQGDGYYQLNWKTAKSYAGTCKTLHLDIGDGVTHDAYFVFKK